MLHPDEEEKSIDDLIMTKFGKLNSEWVHDVVKYGIHEDKKIMKSEQMIRNKYKTEKRIDAHNEKKKVKEGRE